MKNGYRKEHDTLGEVLVPKEALYGAQTERAVQNFRISSRTAHPALIRAYVRLKKAAALANAAEGALGSKEADLIVRASDQILAKSESQWSEIFPVDAYQAGAGTSQNMNVNEVLANVGNQIAGKPLGTYSPLHPNDHVNRSQSTNDSFPTAMRLAALELSDPVIEELEKLAASFATKGREFSSIPKSARTHLQDAVPMTLGQEFTAYSKTLTKCAEWVRSSIPELSQLGIGGSAAGTGLTVPKGFRKKIIAELKKLTGQNLREADDLREAMQSQRPVAHYSSMLRLATLELTRICNDLRLLASGPMTGLAEIVLPAVQPGSSIMPGKVNPSILEMVNQALYSVLGMDQTIALCEQAGQLELNVMMPMMAYTALEASMVFAAATRTLRERCVDGIMANETRLRKFFESTPQVATALSPRLGYERTAELVKRALREGKSVIDLVREEKLLGERELSELLDVKKLTGQ